MKSPPNPARIAQALAPERNSEFGSFLRSEYITDCTCKSVDGKASGLVRFRCEEVFEGKIRYSASKTDKGWVLDEFLLPNYKIRLVLNKEGIWEKEKLKK